MALTVTSRGTGTHNTGATTLVPGGRSATLAAGSMGVFCIALDNAGSAGAAVAAPSSWTDAKGNVWTRRQNALYDNGAASAGIEMAIYTADITVALLTGDLGTITWAGGVSPVAKAWTWYEVIPSTGTVTYTTGGTIAGATAANAQVVTATVPVGDAVIAGYFSENVAAVTGDADATNGSWTAQQTATIGSTTSGVRIATQQKVQTTTPSTQSYDVTVSSQDRIAGYILVHENVPITATPTTLALTLATFAPTVTIPNNQLVTPDVLAVVLSTFAPTVGISDHQRVTPTTAGLATAAFAPAVTTPVLATPAAASLTLSAFVPTVLATAHVVATPTTATLTTSAFAPSVTTPVLTTPTTPGLTLTTFAPTVATPVVATPDLVALTLTAFEPTVAATAHQTVVPTTVDFDLTTFAPSVPVTDHQRVVPTTQALTLTTFDPAVSFTAHITAVPDAATLTLATFAPGVAGGQGLTVVPTTAALTLAPFAPSVAATAHQRVTPTPASLALTAFAPGIVATDHVVARPSTAELVLAMFAPTVSTGIPPVGLTEDLVVLVGMDVGPIVSSEWPAADGALAFDPIAEAEVTIQ